jgi:hypothetical protein
VHFFLIRTASRKWFFFYSAHHQVFDGWSDTIFWKELNACYLAFSRGEEPTGLVESPLSYLDYALWQCETLFQTEQTQVGIMQAAALGMGGSYGSAPTPDKAGVPCESLVRNAPYYRGGPWTEVSFDGRDRTMFL